MPQGYWLFRRSLMPMWDADGGSGGGGATGGGAAGNGAPTPGSVAQVYTEDYVRALRAEAAGHRTKAKGFEDQLGVIRKAYAIADGQEPDWAKVLADRDAAHKTALEAAGAKAKGMLLAAEVKSVCAELGVVDSEAAAKLADLSKAQVGDDGKLSGVKEAIEELLKAKPYLKGTAAGKGAVGAAGGNPGPGGDADPVAAAKAFAQERNKGPAQTGGYNPWATK